VAFGRIPDLLATRGEHAVDQPVVQWRFLASVIVAGTFVYGSAMGSFGVRPLQALYSAIKVPLFVGMASLICLPSFFVLNTVLGLRDDFAAACRAILAAQATLAIVLASLAPITIFAYVSDGDYATATGLNGVMFLIATLAGHTTLSRHYRELIARNPRHRVGRAAWLLLYVFVSIQMAWVLRPFIGAPTMRTVFFRPDMWGNAYVEVAGLVSKILRLR
jgi:hypothetical protein